jgi:TolB-like protein
MKRFFLIFLIVFSSMSFSSSKEEEKKLSIAVSSFVVRAVSENDAESMADRLSAELSATNVFQVLERSRMKDLFEEAAFQQTWCDEPACATAIGNLISVDKLVLGSISKVGNIFTVNVRLVNVSTGEIEKNLSEDCDCAIEELLTSVLKRMARKLAGVSGSGEGAIVALDKGDASIFVKSTPEGARVFIDGRMVEGVTPITVQGIPAGKHDIRVQKNDSSASVVLDLSSRKIKKIKLTLKQEKTSLKIFTEPSEAEVYIDAVPTRSNKHNQTTPAVFNNISNDSVRVFVFRPGFLDTSFNVDIRKNRENLISFKLTKADSTYQLLQKKFTKSRSERRIGLRMSVTSILVAVLGGASLYLAEEDFSQAAKLKDRLDVAMIRTGTEYEKVKEDNRKATEDGKAKQLAGLVSAGAAAIGLSLGLVFYF